MVSMPMLQTDYIFNVFQVKNPVGSLGGKWQPDSEMHLEMQCQE